MTFGPRILKTGLAVTLSIYMCMVFDLEHAVFAGVAAILAIQPSVYRTWKQLLDQIITNTLGASISLFFIYFFGEHPITIGFVIILMISISIKLKMETTIPLTLVTVIAIMGATGSEDVSFAIERFLVILIGTITAIMINITIFPPNYKKKFTEDLQKTFQHMSLLMRTAISDEMREASYQDIHQKFQSDLTKLQDQFKLLDEERSKLGKSTKLNARELIVLKQMIKAFREAHHLLACIEDHYFQSQPVKSETTLFDEKLEELVKYHEYLLLKYLGLIKEDHNMIGFKILDNQDAFYSNVLEKSEEDKEQKLRQTIIASSIVHYSFHLERLEKVIHQYIGNEVRNTVQGQY
ncbi:hypothetical protein Q73_15880 [Bacillus coahuilensis m2-6]|nr:hypothetical protein Q73_15880 [Bacillus coahuilensis m2-6]